MKNSRLIFVALAIIALCAVAGGLFGNRVLAVPNEGSEYLRLFAEMVDTVEDHYAVEIEGDDMVHGAIHGMLDTLDRHSNFLPQETFTAIREEQQGKFYGLGIVVSMREDRLTVISPIEGTPAFRLGIMAGDVIARINGEPTEGLSVNEAVSVLRGPKGTSVDISISRPGFKDLLEFSIVRDEVPTHSVTYAFIIEPGIGYVRLKNFTQTTAEEIEATLDALQKEGMEKLLLDLRNNSGGLLDQAIQVSDFFLSAGQKIVYTRGRILSSNQEFYAMEGNGSSFQENMPLVILVNRGSASASEIVSGAVQDSDRGLVVGETTWGKGLVQTVYPLSYNSGLALTTANYFTPSGRCIQRNYDTLDDFLFPDEEETDPLEDIPIENRDIHYTETGREVTGGGGITPDVVIKQTRRSEFVQRLFVHSVFFNFGIRYLADHGEEVGPDFQADDAALDQLRQYLNDKELEFTENEIVENIDRLKREVTTEILSSKFNLEAGFRYYLRDDVQVVEALKVFEQAEALAANADRMRQMKANAPEETVKTSRNQDTNGERRYSLAAPSPKKFIVE